MKRSHLTLGFAVTVAIATAACQRDAEPAPAASPAAAEITPDDVRDPAPAAAPATDATEIADMTSPVADAPRGFDTKAFAGTFAAPGATLTVETDGRYRMSVHAESANADLESAGTWTLEADGKHVLLDPESKSDPDRRYALASNDELRPVDGGEPLRRRSE